MKPKSKKVGIIGIALAVVCLGIGVAADVACGVMSDMIMLHFRSSENTSVDFTPAQALEKAREESQKIEEEGIVMLKNNGVLPLSTSASGKKKINLFGNCSYQTLYQGSGSASSWFKQDQNTDIKTGLENANFAVNPGLWQFYKDNYQDRNDQAGGQTNMTGADANILEQTMAQYQSYSYESKNILTYSEEYSDTAVIVFGRAGGEGSDAKLDMTGIVGGDAGKHYLELQNVEIELLDYVKANYDKVIVLLNTASPMELGFTEAENVDACVWMGMPGSTGNNAVGEVLAGEVTPSGHLVDTYAYDLTSNPTYYNFGDYTYNNYDSKYNKYVYYQEGIYVGYRYYETAAKDGYINYDSTVQFPFGYGLSYTTFDWSEASFTVGGKGNTITASVKVTNTGTVYSGKDVVQLYYHAPFDAAEGIEKSDVVLGGFGKTKLLAPGESDVVTITMDYDDMASYDYKNEKAYVLSAGEYELSLRHDSHTKDDSSASSHAFTLDNKIVYNEAGGKRSSDKKVATNLFDDVTAGDGNFGSSVKMTTRTDWTGTTPKSREENQNKAADQAVIARMTNGYSGSAFNLDTLDADHPEAVMPKTGQKNGLVISDMIGLDYNDPLWDSLLDELTVNEMKTLFGKCGWHNPAVISIEKAMAVDMDGAEGLHDLTAEKTSNQYPITVILASSWDKDLSEEFGSVYADECLANGVSALYAPSMNTHRSPFGGRNFEYYSEDGLLAGKMATAEINGLWEKGIGVYCKHYMLNDQETNRQKLVHTWANEQAIREIYAKPFEISTKEGHASGYMAAYNAVGACWTGASYSLMTALPRGEWGFNGRIITDACDDYVTYNSDAAVVAGVDMWLTAFGATLSEKITNSAYGMTCLRRAAHDQLYVFANSSAAGMTIKWNYGWIAIPVSLSVVMLGAIAAISVFMIYPAFFMKKDKKGE
ncbi:MAG: glycoside hydrolase family 3 C-terminal domain-containing protein [Bacilli bacterium]